MTSMQIANALGVALSAVESNWPAIDQCLYALCKDSYTERVRIAALATIRVECPPFHPIREYGTDEQHERMYGGRADLGNTAPGDGARYAGRGYIQLTGKSNYAAAGARLAIDLIADPDRALNPIVAADIFADYFYTRHCHDAANAEDWKRVRKLVNGGYNGLDEFLIYVEKLIVSLGDGVDTTQPVIPESLSTVTLTDDEAGTQ